MKKNFSFSLLAPKVLALLGCTLLFLCVLCDEIFATAIDDHTGLFYSANKLYEQAKYEQAVGEYKKIIERGSQSGPLYYNIGNCYFKLGSMGKTILYYEKAIRLIPNDPELRFNYNYVVSLLEDKIELPKINWFMKKFLDIAGIMVFSKWLVLIIIIWLILIASIIIKIFTPGFSRIFKHLIIIESILLGICILCAITQYKVFSSPAAIVIPKEVPVRYGPGEAEVEAFMLHEGTKVEIRKAEENWYQIQLPDGKSGWLPKETVEWI